MKSAVRMSQMSVANCLRRFNLRVNSANHSQARCGLGTVIERNRKCLLQKEAIDSSSLTGRQHELQTGGLV